jgi:hypothetical protein
MTKIFKLIDDVKMVRFSGYAPPRKRGFFSYYLNIATHNCGGIGRFLLIFKRMGYWEQFVL